MGNQQYLHNVAGSVMGQLKVSALGDKSRAYSFHYCVADDLLQKLWSQFGPKVMDIVEKMGPSARGRIAASYGSNPSSNFRHWDVNQGKMLNGDYPGDHLLTLLATYVVIAAIADIIRAEARRLAEEEQAAEDELARGEADYIHHGLRRHSGLPTSP